jgi:hypothetical protein
MPSPLETQLQRAFDGFILGATSVRRPEQENGQRPRGERCAT